MENEISNLWPMDDIDPDSITTPTAILQQQASYLGQATKNVLEARVEVSIFDRDRDQFYLSFRVVAPTLDDFTVELFAVKHGIELYPVTPVSGERHPPLDTQQELVEYVGCVLKSDRTKKILRALLAQARGPVAQ
ncbi:MAG: hypothetical protein NTY38_13705 [Acidobacteria bacterium]|nr:hypothetical protein [Acidobacteriota bacterium]